MAAAMIPRLVAAATLVALMCAVAVAQVPAAAGAPVCQYVDQDVVNACFASLGKGEKVATAPRNGGTVQVDCCVAFGGHSCLCQMKAAWKAQGRTAQNRVKCVKNKTC